MTAVVPAVFPLAAGRLLRLTLGAAVAAFAVQGPPAAAQGFGFQFSHPVLRERGIPVSEYQAIGRNHDAECQARALELVARRTSNASTPEDEKRERERGDSVASEYVRCMESKGWVRIAR